MWSYTPASRKWQFVQVTVQFGNCPSKSRGVYLTDGHFAHVFLHCCQQPLVAFDLLQNKQLRPSQECSQLQLPHISNGAVAGRGQDVLIFGGSGEYSISKQDILWQLRMLSRDSWVWFLHKKSKRNPLYGRSMVVTSDFTSQQWLFLFGGIELASGELLFASTDLWKLHMKDKKWTLESGYHEVPLLIYSAGTVLHSSVLVLFGGGSRVVSSSWGVFRGRQDLWGYYDEEKRWSEISTETKPPGRFLHSAARIDSKTMIIFGGTDIATLPFGALEGLPLTDVWSLYVPSEESGRIAYWTCLSQLGPNVSILHSSVYMNGRLIVYGGAASWRGSPFLAESRGFELQR